MSEVSSSSERRRSESRQRRRRGHPRKKSEGELNPAQAVKRAAQAVVPAAGPAEEPLTDEEVRQLKRHFEFLRTYRRPLKLRVNATEDLLLNGKTEPTHRGVCQHLLAKVDRARVLQVSERMSAPEATRFLAGMLRLAPEIAFLLRFLECVKESSEPMDAASALTEALHSLDFENTSDAQMRQVLRLIVDVFPAEEQPAFLLGLLRGPAFRDAFDRSSEGLPESFARIFSPMREVHELLSTREKGKGRRRHHKERTNSRSDLLREGALLLLRVDPKSLLSFPRRVRHRMFELVVGLPQRGDDIPVASLTALFQSLRFDRQEERSDSVQRLVGAFLRLDQEKAARLLLRKESNLEAQQLLELLDAPRAGHFAFPLRRDGSRENREGSLDKRDGSRENKGQKSQRPLPSTWINRWATGVDLQTRKRVRLYLGDSAEPAVLRQLFELWRGVLLPQVQLPFAFENSTEEAPPYIVMQRLESGLGRYLERASHDQFKSALLDVCRIANGLFALGIVLPDGSLTRFAVDRNEGVWLSDLIGARHRAGSGDSESFWLRDTIQQAYRLNPRIALSDEDAEWLAGEPTIGELVKRLGLLPKE